MSGARPPVQKGHGTEARARKHRRDGEKPCPACLAAETAASYRRHQLTGWNRPRRLTVAERRHIERILEEIFGDLPTTHDVTDGILG